MDKVKVKDLDNLRKNAYESIKYKEKPSRKESLGDFFVNCGRSLRFILAEKENIFFAFMQVVVIALTYYVWIQALDLIPEEVWQKISDDKTENDGALANLILLLWSFVCIGLAAYPLGLLTACMGASFILRFNGQPSTIFGCLRLVLGRSWSLWIFSWIDAWWTILRIMERLPKKKDRTPLSQKIVNEAIYQAWKLASLGFIPALICGRKVTDAIKDSLSLTRERFVGLAKLRLGYSLVCWIFGIVGYIGGIFIIFALAKESNSHLGVYSFYVYAGVPLILTISFILMIFRPLYIISACRIYANYTRDKNIKIDLPEKVSGFASSLIIFVLMAVLLACAYLYRDKLGISEILRKYL